jgi:hypothetical protein
LVFASLNARLLTVLEKSRMKNRCVSRRFFSYGVVLAGLMLGLMAPPVQAGSITYTTAPGATAGGEAVDASAVFTISGNTLTIVVTNLLADPNDVGQNVSGLSFTLGNGGTLTGSSLTSGVGQAITVQSGGSFTLGSTVSAGWVYSDGSSSGTLNDLSGSGHAGPAHTLIGAPGIGGTYDNGNGSIAGNGAHNPFLNQTVTFTITGPGISDSTTITSDTFSFGTTSGVTAAGTAVAQTTSVPEPSSLVLSLSGVGVLGLIGVYRSRRRGKPGRR